jgi:uncharacterized membrane protein
MLRNETRFERAIFRWCGVAVLLGVVVGLQRVHAEAGPAGVRQLGELAAVSLLLLGKFVVFSGLHEDTPSPWVLAMMVWLIDLLIAFGLLSGLEGLERAPVLGRWLRRMRRKAQVVLGEYPGLERMAFAGVSLFVMLPLAATGAVTGSFAARLIGLGRVPGVLAIALGSAGTSFSFALLASFVGERAEDLARSPVIVGATLLALLVIGRIAYRRVLGRLRER